MEVFRYIEKFVIHKESEKELLTYGFRFKQIYSGERVEEY